jgi:hypothetical protein
MRNGFLFVFLASFAFFRLAGQSVTVEAALDTSKMRIGEQVKLNLYVTYKSNLKNLRVQWPAISDTLTGKIDVISIGAIDTMLPSKTNSDRIFQHQQVLISAYDSGYFMVPAFSFTLDNDTNKVLKTKPLLIEVHTVPTTDTLSRTKDIKPPFNEPFSWKWYSSYLYWAIGIIAAILATILITRYFTRKSREIVREPEKPKVPPHIAALQALEKIKEEQVWKDGKVKEYYSMISETVRAYIEDRFQMNALESTTDEIMTAFRSQVVDKESKEKLAQMLMLSDLVKFAKMTPIEVEHQITLQHAFDFVNGTKREDPIIVQPAEPSPPDPSKT